MTGAKMERPESFDALEEVWRKRVESARERYLAAVSQTREAEKELPAGDRGAAREQARLAEREALAQYLVVLRDLQGSRLEGEDSTGGGIIPVRLASVFQQWYSETSSPTSGFRSVCAGVPRGPRSNREGTRT